MVRETYLELLESVNRDLLGLCAMSCESMHKSITYLESWDRKGEKEVIVEDVRINEAFIELQEKCFQIIARQQPVAIDLRFLGSSLTVANNLERCGDYSADIAKTVIMMKPRIEDGIKEIKEMDRTAEEALKLSVEAFTKRDLSIIERVCEIEKQNDVYFGKLLDKLKKSTKTCKDPELLFRTAIVGRHLERFADRAVNISNRAAYVVTADRKYLR
ncbi:MAG: phosphate signaling complex protein PhoU [Candidatus Micrarchaeota archaeon]